MQDTVYTVGIYDNTDWDGLTASWFLRWKTV